MKKLISANVWVRGVKGGGEAKILRFQSLLSIHIISISFLFRLSPQIKSSIALLFVFLRALYILKKHFYISFKSVDSEI